MIELVKLKAAIATAVAGGAWIVKQAKTAITANARLDALEGSVKEVKEGLKKVEDKADNHEAKDEGRHDQVLKKIDKLDDKVDKKLDGIVESMSKLNDGMLKMALNK